MTNTERLEEINKEIADPKLSGAELDALLDEVQEISAKERQNLDNLVRKYIKPKGLGWIITKGVLAAMFIFTLGIHLVKLVWLFILLNWNLW